VELIVQHEDEAFLQDLLRRLRQGPGHVEGLNVYPESEASRTGFYVGHSR
jgi:hypothetical protein